SNSANTIRISSLNVNGLSFSSTRSKKSNQVPSIWDCYKGFVDNNLDILFLQHLNSYAHSKLKERCKSIIHKHKIFSIFHVPISSNGRGVATLYSPSTFKKAKIVFKDKEYRILSTILTTW